MTTKNRNEKTMSKIHAKDLMVGDYVQNPASNHIFKVQTISGGEQETLHYVTAKNSNGDFLERSVWEGVPLSPEILEKNGWIKNDIFMKLDNDENTELAWTDRCGACLYKNGYHMCDCQYVHELQHILRLCGFEKEIQL